jgi:uncharacterized protein (DUF488 family)
VVALYTIGHSTRSFEELVDLLRASGVEVLADVRTVPRSRRVPHFDRAALAERLPRHGIECRHLPALGGLRHPRRDSINTGWRNEAFRGYADHMATAEFQAALEGLIELSRDRDVAVMCAEAVPWRCHRSLIADAVVVRGQAVLHILGPGQTQPHALTPFAHVEGVRVTYPGAEQQPLL